MLKDYPNVDGVVALTHGDGCGMQFDGVKHRMLNRVMGGMAKHPNVGGFVLIGLGCEQGALGHLIKEHGLVHIEGTTGNRIDPPTLSMQDYGGTGA